MNSGFVGEWMQRALIIPVSRYVNENPSRFSRVRITNVLPRFLYSKGAL